MNHKKRIRQLERRIAALEANTGLAPANHIDSNPVNFDTLWRTTVNDHANGWDCNEDWNTGGYL